MAGAGGFEPPPSALTVQRPTVWTTPQQGEFPFYARKAVWPQRHRDAEKVLRLKSKVEKLDSWSRPQASDSVLVRLCVSVASFRGLLDSRSAFAARRAAARTPPPQESLVLQAPRAKVPHSPRGRAGRRIRAAEASSWLFPLLLDIGGGNPRGTMAPARACVVHDRGSFFII